MNRIVRRVTIYQVRVRFIFQYYREFNSYELNKPLPLATHQIRRLYDGSKQRRGSRFIKRFPNRTWSLVNFDKH